MARIRKQIVSEGIYRLADGTVAVVPASRINHWASEGTRFLQSGNKIPLPWSHIDPVTKQPVVMGPHLERSDINAGFWDTLESVYVADINPITGKPYGQTLIGYADVPGDPQDHNSPAGKLGTTVKETSIFAKDFIDGGSRPFRDVPLHIAAVTHAIQPGQPNFAIAMSQMVMAYDPSNKPRNSGSSGSYGGGNGGSSNNNSGSRNGDGNSSGKNDAQNQQQQQKQNQYGDDNPGQQSPQNAGSPSIQQIIEQLRQCGIALPNDTNESNFLSWLMVALGQKAISDNGGADPNGSLTDPPEGAQIKSPAPVAMANTPITAENFAAIPREVFMSHPAAKALDDTNQMLLGLLSAQAKETRKAKLDALVAAHPALAEYAKTTLQPMIDSLQMSFGANAPPQPFDIAFGAVSAMAATLPRPAAKHPLAHLLANSAIAMSAAGTPQFSADSVIPPGAGLIVHDLPPDQLNTDGVLKAMGLD